VISSPKAIDLIISEEVGNQAQYKQHPEFPGGYSGVTVGIGYDLGYNSPDKIKADWSALVTPEILRLMLSCSGLTAHDAAHALAKVKSVVIPWTDRDWET